MPSVLQMTSLLYRIRTTMFFLIWNAGLHKVRFRTHFLWPLNMFKVIANIWNSKAMIFLFERISLFEVNFKSSENCLLTPKEVTFHVGRYYSPC